MNSPQPAAQMPHPSPDADPLAGSGILVLDKPGGMTSHDCVSRVRRAFHTRKVGHAGTLDPLAVGVLILGINRGTKFLSHLVTTTKTYEATIRLGCSTTTDDSEGTVLRVADATTLSDADISDTASHFRGEIMQRPAAVSAIKVNGQRAHALVRAGQTVNLSARPVTIHRLDITHIDRPGDSAVDVSCTVHCSSGTYIRSLARDLGDELGVGGHVTALCRTAVGPFTLDDAATLEQCDKHPRLSLSLDEALTRCYPTLTVSANEAWHLSHGHRLPGRGLTEIHAAVDPEGRSIALVAEHSGTISTTFVARPSTLA